MPPKKDPKKWLYIYGHSMNPVNRIPAIAYFGGARIYFPLAKQRVNFLQKRLPRRNICTNFGDGKTDVQRVKITHVSSQSSIELRAIH
jgi:hypothetical protein